jgi:hypothetical protein
MKVDGKLLPALSYLKTRAFSNRVTRFRVQRLLYVGDRMLDAEIKNMIWVAKGREILEGDHRTVFTGFHLKL